MTQLVVVRLLILEAWFTVGLSVYTAWLCWRSARTIHNAHRTLRLTQCGLLVVLAGLYVLALLGGLPGSQAALYLQLVILLLVASLAAREIIEAPRLGP